jgi:hypothetical protein
VVAVSGALLLVISPWAPSTPFSSLLTVWARWIADLLPGFLFVGKYDGFVAAFLPLFGTATLIYPIFAFCDQVLAAPKPLVRIPRATAVLMFLLSGMPIVDATLATSTPWELGQIAARWGQTFILRIASAREQPS